MIRHGWTVLCTRSSVDSESNNISLFDLLEQLTISEPQQGPGIAVFPHEVVSLWTRDNLGEGGVAETRFVIVAPDATRTEGPALSIDLTAFHRSRMRSRAPGLPIQGAGLYWIATELRQGENPQWAEVGRIPLEVRFGEVPQGA